MNEKKHFKIITILIPIIGAIIYAFKKQLVHFMFSLPPCPFYTIYNLYCPACGNTRSVNALLQGDILLSLHYNIIPILLILTLMLGYIELAFYSFGKKKKILPRSKFLSYHRKYPSNLSHSQKFYSFAISITVVGK